MLIKRGHQSITHPSILAGLVLAVLARELMAAGVSATKPSSEMWKRWQQNINKSQCLEQFKHYISQTGCSIAGWREARWVLHACGGWCPGGQLTLVLGLLGADCSVPLYTTTHCHCHCARLLLSFRRITGHWTGHSQQEWKSYHNSNFCHLLPAADWKVDYNDRYQTAETSIAKMWWRVTRKCQKGERGHGNA